MLYLRVELLGFFFTWTFISKYHQNSNIKRTLVGNILVDHSDEFGVSPVGAPTSSFWTQYTASMDCAKATARWDEKHWIFGILCGLY